MAFEGLTTKLQDTFKKLTGRGKLNEGDVKIAMREIRMALLEADVNYGVVKTFIKSVSDKAVGKEVMNSLTPGQQVIKIVRDDLTALMGKSEEPINLNSSGISVIMLAGLQGAGKTTTAGKLGAYLRKKHAKNPLLVACDIYRPAAIEQLKITGNNNNIPVFDKGTDVAPDKIVKEALAYAKKNAHDLVIIDTAGRLHIQEDLMEELERIKAVAQPQEILLVVDAMTGQDAVNVADTFNKKIDVTGVILTKLDGDARGGAAISVRAVTGKPIKFAGIGEKTEDFEVFYPDRMASRILGMGDVLTLIEKAEANFDQEKALKMQEKLKNQDITLEDFLEQLQQIKGMGSLKEMIDMIPGANKAKLGGVDLDDKQIGRTEAIIQSMTKKERKTPNIINASRRKRIAAGSGTKVQDVNRLLKSYDEFKKMMKKMTTGKKRGRLGNLKFPF
jgi:signal recognition particle subunit SRP54